MKQLRCFFIGTLMSLIGITYSNAQYMDISTAIAAELVVCGEPGTFSVELTNDSSATLTNIVVNVVFPTGIQYVTNSLAETTPHSSYNVTQQNVSDITSVIFALNTLPSDSTVSFSFDVEARFDAIAYQQSGAIFTNTINVSYGGGTDSEQTDPYNILFGALSITKVTKMVENVFVGQVFTRKVTIVNGGFGKISSFTLKDIHDGSLLKVVGTDIGVLDTNTEEITLSTTDFSSVGNGDNWFDLNESIVITQTIQAVGCNDEQSELYVYWGCDGKTTISNKKFPFTNVSLYAPNVQATAFPSFNTCLDFNTADEQMLLLVNKGTGPANDLVAQIYQTKDNGYDQGVFSRIDETNIQYKVGENGSYTALTPTNSSTTTNTGDWSCLGADAVGKVWLDLPVMQPGDSIWLKWDSYTCDNITRCGRVDLIGWDYQVSNTDMCNSRNYTLKNRTGQPPKRKSFAIFAEFPSDMVNGQTETFSYTLTSTSFTMPEEGNTPHFSLKFDIPVGLIWSGNSDDIEFVGNNTSWPSSYVDYNSATRELEAHFPLPAPFSLLNSEIKLDLTADCNESGAGAGLVNVVMQPFFVMDSLCSPASDIPLTCPITTTTRLHCPGVNCVGMGFNGFSVARTNFGDPDNNQNGLADNSGTLDMTKVKDNRVMVGDTFNNVYSGTVHTNANFPNWSYGYAFSSIPNGNKVSVIGASLSVVDQSTGTTLTCDNIAFTDAIVGGKRKATFDFSVATLASQGCSSFSGFVFEDGDQVTLTALYKVSGNIGAKVEQVVITNNEFYLSDIPNPTNDADKYQCDTWDGNLTMIGYEWQNYNVNNWTVNGCTKNVHQFFRFKMGKGPDANNLFPFEYRNWGHVKQVRVEIPTGYIVTNARFYQKRTQYTNKQTQQLATLGSPVSITPTGSGSSYIYDLESKYKPNGGNIELSDDGFNGYVRLTVKPVCTVPQNTYENLEWFYTFNEGSNLSDTATGEYAANNPDRIQYRRSNLNVSAIFQTTEGTGITVSWDIKVKESGVGNANNAFLTFNSNTINVQHLINLSNSDTIVPTNDIYQLGNINKKQTKNYRVVATYNSCNLDQLDVSTGYDCEGYPANLADYHCALSTYPLYINPEPSELQVRINNITPPTECAPYTIVEVDMLSSKLATVKDLFVNVQVTGNGNLTVDPDSSMVDYPYNSGYAIIPTPDINGATYSFTASDIAGEIGKNGLVGVTDVTKNRVRMRFNLAFGPNFKSGDRALISVGGYRACGTALPTTNVAYDPSAVFSRVDNATVGLDGDENNWATAFGDYNNDGFVDLFLVNYELDKPNQLYKNNGDGTFTRVTTGNIVTDLASSTAASWGDYNNDGHLDLFVANNIGFKNFLYRNNGDETFTSILDDPIVNYIGYSHGSSWVDYDNDGFLDMFSADFFPTRFNKLYHNNGDGTFTAVTSSPIVTAANFSVSGVWGDYDNDGDMDLFVANTNDENNALYRNEGNGQFTAITTGNVVLDGGKSTGASWGDYDNDLDLDLFVANSGDQDNFLYENNGDGTFTKVTSGVVVTSGGNSHGSSWVDIDNDGDLDLFVTNDAGENNFLYANNGDGTFTELINDITQDGGKSFGTAWADVENDGDMDLFISNHDFEQNFLYLNDRAKCVNHACFNLKGTNSNASAIGAKIKVLAMIDGTPTWQMREISGQTGGGIGGQNELEVLFGVGEATQIDSVIVEWPSGYVQRLGQFPVNDSACSEIVELAGSEICGTIFFDENENCVIDGSEEGIPNVGVLIQPGNRQVFTDDDGKYSIIVAPGTYTISQIDNNVWEQNCPANDASLTVNVVGIGNQYCDNDFADTAACPLPDLEVSLATTALRVGFESLYAITYGNNGTRPATDVDLTVDFGPHIKPLSASLGWDSQSGTNYTWSLGTLEVGQEFTIYVEDSVLTSATIGDNLTVVATIEGTEDDCNVTDDIFTDINEAVGAIDPNDILVFPAGYIPNDQELTYKIRFQNVGNDLVSRVVVRDELPESLDLTTLIRGSASHPFQFEIQGERTLVWTFDNINLPDSTTNEPESHGFVTFKIKPNEGIADGVEIPNSALIFFDAQEPIQTNTVINTIGEPANVKAGDLILTPNPMNAYTTLRIVPLQQNQNEEEISEVYIYTATGNLIYQQFGLRGKTWTITRGALLPGYYIVHVVTNKTNNFTGKLVIVR